MTELFTELWSVLTSAISNFTGAIKDAFLNIIYVDPDASTKVVSDFAKFGFALVGLSLGLSLIYFIVKKIKA